MKLFLMLPFWIKAGKYPVLYITCFNKLCHHILIFICNCYCCYRARRCTSDNVPGLTEAEAPRGAPRLSAHSSSLRSHLVRMYIRLLDDNAQSAADLWRYENTMLYRCHVMQFDLTILSQELNLLPCSLWWCYDMMIMFWSYVTFYAFKRTDTS
jgi:hypothetical protein